MAFKDAIVHDNRTLFNYYWEFLQKTQPLIETFMVKHQKELSSLKYIHFFCAILMDFALSSLFFSGKFISNANQNNGDNFWYNLPISLYTYVFSSVINIILNKLSSSGSGLDSIKENHAMNQNHKGNAIRIFLKCYMFRITIYMIIHIGLMGLFANFMIAFCSVYTNSQWDWLKTGLISTAISMFLPFSFLFSVLRTVSLYFKSIILFKISEITTYLFG